MKTLNFRGFALIELAIVLVIIGLVVSGVLVGQNLKDSAEVNSVVKEYNTIKSAIYQFHGKFKDLPGDAYMHRYYTADQYITIGDRNGYIGNSSSSGSQETFAMWRHLQISGMIAGEYTGLVGSGSVPGSNIYASEVERGGYHLRLTAGAENNYFTYNTAMQQVMHYGGGDNGCSWSHSYCAPILNTQQAYNIDVKIDNGNASTGILHVGKGFASGLMGDCVTGNYSAGYDNVDFDFTDTDNRECILTFIMTDITAL